MCAAEFIPDDLADLSGTVSPSQLPASGVTAGTYTLATITVDTHGRVTRASSGTGGGGVTSVAGRTGDVVLTESDVSGLGTIATHAATDFQPAGSYLTPSSTLDPTRIGPGTAAISVSGNAATATTAVTISGSITESQVSGLTADLASRATDSAVVHLTGSETITGDKIWQSAGGVYTWRAASGAGAALLDTAYAGIPGWTSYSFTGSFLASLALTAPNAFIQVAPDPGGTSGARVTSNGFQVFDAISSHATNLLTWEHAYPSPRISVGAGAFFAQLGVNVMDPSYGGFAVRGAAGQASPLVSLQGLSGTGTARDLGYLDAGFTEDTDAIYLGHVSLVATGYTGFRGEGVRVTSHPTAGLTYLSFFGGGTGASRQTIAGDTTADLAALQAVVKALLQALNGHNLIVDSTT